MQSAKSLILFILLFFAAFAKIQAQGICPTQVVNSFRAQCENNKKNLCAPLISERPDLSSKIVDCSSDEEMCHEALPSVADVLVGCTRSAIHFVESLPESFSYAVAMPFMVLEFVFQSDESRVKNTPEYRAMFSAAWNRTVEVERLYFDKKRNGRERGHLDIYTCYDLNKQIEDRRRDLAASQEGDINLGCNPRITRQRPFMSSIVAQAAFADVMGADTMEPSAVDRYEWTNTEEGYRVCTEVQDKLNEKFRNCQSFENELGPSLQPMYAELANYVKTEQGKLPDRYDQLYQQIKQTVKQVREKLPEVLQQEGQKFSCFKPEDRAELICDYVAGTVLAVKGSYDLARSLSRIGSRVASTARGGARVAGAGTAEVRAAGTVAADAELTLDAEIGVTSDASLRASGSNSGNSNNSGSTGSVDRTATSATTDAATTGVGVTTSTPTRIAPAATGVAATTTMTAARDTGWTVPMSRTQFSPSTPSRNPRTGERATRAPAEARAQIDTETREARDAEAVVAVAEVGLNKTVNDIYKTGATKYMNDNALGYANELSKANAQAKFIQRLGFQYVEGAAVPDLNRVMSRVDNLIDEALDKARLSRGDEIRPAIVLEDVQTGELKAFLFQNIPSSGYKLPKSSIIDADQFAKFVAQGRYPIGRADHLVEYAEPMLFHDMAHIGGYVDHPEYMKAIRDEFKKIVNFKTPIRGQNIEFRVNYALESATLPDRAKSAQFAAIKKRYNFSRNLDDPSINSTTYRRKIDSMTPEQLNSLHRDLSEQNFMVEYGGGERSVRRHLAGPGSTYRDGYAESPQIYLEAYENARLRTTEIDLLKDIVNRGNELDQKRELLARYMAAIDHGRFVDPVSIVRASFSVPTSQERLLYSYFCLSGAFSRSSNVYITYCK